MMRALLVVVVTGSLLSGLRGMTQKKDGIYIHHLDGNEGCTDEGIWILDGSVDCSHLHTQSVWGLDKEAEYRCTRDRNTKCCRTCRNLGFSKASPGKPGGYAPSPTPVPPTQASVTKTSSSSVETSNGPSSNECVDKGVWIMDSRVDCTHLHTPSIWGLTSQASRLCTEDKNTDCCKTCRQLGFTKGPSGPLPETTAPATKAPSTQAASGGKPQAGSTDPHCKDEQIWIADMSVDCRYLEETSIYGVHSNPEYYCLQYSLTSCCKTCAKLGFSKRTKPGQAPTTTTTPKATSTLTSTTTTTTTTTTTKATTAKPREAAAANKPGIRAERVTNLHKLKLYKF